MVHLLHLLHLLQADAVFVQDLTRSPQRPEPAQASDTSDAPGLRPDYVQVPSGPPPSLRPPSFIPPREDYVQVPSWRLGAEGWGYSQLR
jgi:hypothetical protein